MACAARRQACHVFTDGSAAARPASRPSIWAALRFAASRSAALGGGCILARACAPVRPLLLFIDRQWSEKMARVNAKEPLTGPNPGVHAGHSPARSRHPFTLPVNRIGAVEQQLGMAWIWEKPVVPMPPVERQLSSKADVQRLLARRGGATEAGPVADRQLLAAYRQNRQQSVGSESGRTPDMVDRSWHQRCAGSVHEPPPQ